MRKIYSGLLVVLLGCLANLAVAAGGGGPTSPYYSLKPPFVVNVVDGERVRHMQITTQLHATDIALVSHLESHKPAIQHALVMLFSGKSVGEIKTVQGKEKLRQEALAAVQQVMKDSIGDTIIDEVYFTEFIIQ